MSSDQPLSNALAFTRTAGAADWLTATDQAAVYLGLQLAKMIDVAIDTGEVADVAVLSPKYMAVLQQLHLTTETRNQGKSDDAEVGASYADKYLRLIDTKTVKRPSAGDKRRPDSKPTS
jgi:hypothetical protein